MLSTKVIRLLTSKQPGLKDWLLFRLTMARTNARLTFHPLSRNQNFHNGLTA